MTQNNPTARSQEVLTANKTWFVSRHPGSIEWIKQSDTHIDEFVTHIHDMTLLNPGDKVIGSLPIHMIAEICERGARFFHIQVSIPAEYRGKELSAEQMRSLGGCLTEYYAVKR